MDTKPLWLSIAEGEIGQKEVPGDGSNPRIVEYDACTTLKATSDETPWCSAFVNWIMRQARITGTNSAAARSWLDWGRQIDVPMPGCVVVLKRSNNPASGHVGLYASDVGQGFIKVLGGNQSDQVKYSNFPKSDVLGYRIPA